MQGYVRVTNGHREKEGARNQFQTLCFWGCNSHSVKS